MKYKRPDHPLLREWPLVEEFRDALEQALDGLPDDYARNWNAPKIFGFTNLRKLLVPGVWALHRLARQRQLQVTFKLPKRYENCTFPNRPDYFDRVFYKPCAELFRQCSPGSKIIVDVRCFAAVRVTSWVDLGPSPHLDCKPFVPSAIELLARGGEMYIEPGHQGVLPEVELSASEPFPVMYESASQKGHEKLLSVAKSIEQTFSCLRFNIEPVTANNRALLAATPFVTIGSRDLQLLLTPRLTPRERDCLSLLAGGKRPAEIAHELGISTKRVYNIFESARAKLGTTTRDQTLLNASLLGLLDTETRPV